MLTLVTTIGGATSNSYVTLAEAEAYFEARPHSELWIALTDEQKKQHLIYATKQIDTYITAYGTRVADDQALSFPTEDFYDCKGIYYDGTTIPTGVKDAECEQAIYLAGLDPTKKPSLLTQGFSDATVGSLSVSTDDSKVADKVSNITADLLKCYARFNTNITPNGVFIVDVYRN